MRQKSGPVKAPAEQIVKDIRRATRRHFSAEEKIRIVLEGLRGEESIAELCRREGIVADSITAGRRSSSRPARSGWRATRRVPRPPTRSRTCAARPGSEGGRGRSHPGKPSAQKKHDRGWGGRRMRYPASEKLEIIRLVEQSHLPVKRTLEKLGIPRATFYRWYDRYQNGGPEALDDRSPRPDRVWNRIPEAIRERIIDLALDEPELSPARTGGALHRYRKLLCLRGFGLSPAEGARPDHQPRLHRHQGGRGVQGQDHGAQPALADRLHLSQDHRLGLVLSVDRARRLLPLHRRLEAVHDDEGRGRHRHARSGAGGFRPRPGHGRSPAAAVVGQRLELHLRRSRRMARRPGHGARPRRALPSP